MSQDGDRNGSRPLSSPQNARALLHQLRSPVTAIIGYSDTLSRGVGRGTATPEILLERLAHIKTAARRVDALLDDLKAIVVEADATTGGRGPQDA